MVPRRSRGISCRQQRHASGGRKVCLSLGVRQQTKTIPEMAWQTHLPRVLTVTVSLRETYGSITVASLSHGAASARALHELTYVV
uniref:hypothetical protein n=1 Tax=Shewanella sp. TaxID=50422 RepID=UPI0040480845